MVNGVLDSCAVEEAFGESATRREFRASAGYLRTGGGRSNPIKMEDARTKGRGRYALLPAEAFVGRRNDKVLPRVEGKDRQRAGHDS